MIVVDVGCADHGYERSLVTLIDRFHPEALYGYDPQATRADYTVGGTRVVVEPAAVWTFTGTIGMAGTGTTRTIQGSGHVECLDVLGVVPAGAVLHLDCEGAEFRIVQRLIDHQVDLRLLIVEWHMGHPDAVMLDHFEFPWPVEEEFA